MLAIINLKIYSQSARSRYVNSSCRLSPLLFFFVHVDLYTRVYGSLVNTVYPVARPSTLIIPKYLILAPRPRCRIIINVYHHSRLTLHGVVWKKWRKK